MNTDIDSVLRQLAEDPGHPGLADLEANVFARIATKPRMSARSHLRLSVVAAFGAIMMGAASAGLPPPADAAPTLSPFGPSNPLAPSTLLAGIR